MVDYLTQLSQLLASGQLNWWLAGVQTLLFILIAPLLTGWISWHKCRLQNRAAPALWQPYRELRKLLRKESVIADNASWLFRATPYLVFWQHRTGCQRGSDDCHRLTLGRDC
jgi:hypothetical protein